MLFFFPFYPFFLNHVCTFKWANQILPKLFTSMEWRMTMLYSPSFQNRVTERMLPIEKDV